MFKLYAWLQAHQEAINRERPTCRQLATQAADALDIKCNETVLRDIIKDSQLDIQTAGAAQGRSHAETDRRRRELEEKVAALQHHVAELSVRLAALEAKFQPRPVIDARKVACG